MAVTDAGIITSTSYVVPLEEEAQAERKEEPSLPLISITVSAFNGRSMTADLPINSKVQVLNQQVAIFLGTLSEQVKLLFQGQVLDENCCLVDYGLCSDAFLNALVVLPTAVSEAMQQLSHSNPKVRIQGLRALTDLGSIAEQAIEAVEQVLGDADRSVAIHAALMLGRLGDAASSTTQSLLKFVEMSMSARQTDEDFGKEKEFERLCNSRFDEDFNFIIHSLDPGRIKDGKTAAATDLALVGIHSLGRMGSVTMPLLLRAWLDKDATAITATLAQARGNAQKDTLDVEVLLRDENRLVHMSAAKVFITRLGKHAVPTLEQLLGHTFVGVRHLAAKSLLSETEAFSSLLRVLRTGNSAARVMAAASLVQLGEKARPTLEELTMSVDADLQSTAIQALGDMGDKAAIPALLRTLLDKDYRACVAATTALGKLGEAGLAVLDRALSVDYWAVQEELLTVLEASDEMAVPLLTRMLSAPSIPVCVRAIEILGKLGAAAAPAAPTLAGLLAEGNVNILRSKAVAALKLLGSGAASAIPVLEESLTRLDSNDSIRGEITKVLVNCGQAGMPAILHCLYSTDVTTQRFAVGALGLMGGAAVPHLIAMLEQPHSFPEIQQDIAAALGGAGRLAAAAVLPLCRLLQDRQIWVRFEAATAIGTIAASCDGMFLPGVTLAIDALQGVMGDCDAWVRAAAANALAAFGSLAIGATQRLSHALSHPDVELQKASRHALKRIALSSRKCSDAYVTRRVTRRLMATADRT